MKNSFRLFVMLTIISFGLSAQQKSDYETVQRFQNLAKTISKNIDQAKTVQECAEASTAIDDIEKDFASDKELLDKAIYPDGYGKTIEQLRGKLLIRQRDLGVIESQLVRIAELEVKVRELSDQVSKLNSENEKLMADVKNLSENVRKLSGDLFTTTTPLDSLRNLIVKLRKGIQERDALIFALVDSLFLQYDKNVSDMKDVEKQGLMAKLQKHGIIGNVKRSIIDNITFLEATQLKGSDLVTIVRQQQKFRSQWTGLAPKITNLYLSTKEKKNEVHNIDSMLTIWGDKVDNALWRSLNMLFKEKGFLVKEFSNGEEFVANFSLFVEEQIQNVKKETDDTRYKLFVNFNENLWQTELNPTWLPSLVELSKMSDTQRKDIETKVTEWRSTVAPTISWLIYVLVALGGAIVAILIVRFLRKPMKPKTQP